MRSYWTVPGVKDEQSITPDWRSLNARPIEGVAVKEVAHVPTNDGHLTELFRSEWLPENPAIAQVFQRTFEPGALSAWHVHGETTDRLFCVLGRILVVLFDARADSPTVGEVAEYRIGSLRPTLLIIPPGVYHGVKNIGTELALILNMVDVAYAYDDPDHWRQPPDSPAIPYQFP